MKTISARVLKHVNSKRLRRLVQEVWARLPACDRHVLSALVAEINDHAPLTVSNYGQCSAVGDGHVRVVLARSMRSDSATRAVIAHEFAHALLRHQIAVEDFVQKGWRGPTTGHYWKATRREVKSLECWDEEQADWQVIRWGFKREERAFQYQY